MAWPKHEPQHNSVEDGDRVIPTGSSTISFMDQFQPARPRSFTNLLPAELRWLYVQIRPVLCWHILSFTCFSAGSVFALLNPLILKWLIDDVLPGRHARLLPYAVGLIFLSYEGRVVFTSVGGYLTLRSTQTVALSLRERLLRHLDKLSADYHDATPLGKKVYPLRDPIDEIAYFGSDLVPSLLRTLLAAGLASSAMVALSPRLTVLVVPLVPAFLMTRHHFRRQIERDADQLQEQKGEISGFLEEHLISAVQVQLLQQEKRRERAAFQLFTHGVRSQLRLARTGIRFSIYTSLAIVAAMAAIVGYGGWSALSGQLTVGGLVAFYTYLAQLFDPLSGLVETYARAQRTFASVRLIQSEFARQPTVVDSPRAIRLPDKASADLVFTDVRFGYTKHENLIEIPSLAIPAGARVAIVGVNGAGKSTLAKLAARLYDPTAGFLHLGKFNMKALQIASLRSTICYLGAFPVLFDDTVWGNLQLGKPEASLSELEEALEVVELREFLRQLPRDWKESIGPNGSRLSGGQRQRLAIARALLRKPRILIFDEATCSLDAAAERVVLSRVSCLLPAATVILISHRLASLSCVERVILLQDGRIVQDGSPCIFQTNSQGRNQ